MVPSWTRGSAARGSAGTASGFGSVSATVVVVDVVEVVVDEVEVVLEVVDVVEVVAGVVVDVVTVLEVGPGVAAVADDWSSPHPPRHRSATKPTAIDRRRMGQSASESAHQHRGGGLL